MLSTMKKYKLKFEPVPDGVDYFDLPQTSNSDLSALMDATGTSDHYFGSKERAYAFGSLIDAVVTEEDKINVFKKQFNNARQDDIDFEKALRMRESFFKDPECRMIHRHSDFQKVMIRNVPFTAGNIDFTLPMRCKWDFWIDIAWMGADLKSTAAETQQQFENACRHFSYDRQRAFYMTIAGSDRDMLIGVSKVNYKVFKFRVNRGDEFFKSGMAKLKELAFKYHMLYG